MTPHEIELATALGNCSLLPGSSQKRFCRSMADIARLSPGNEISLRQRHYMEIMAWRLRRQLPGHLIPERRPLPLPPKRREPKKGRGKRVSIGSSPQPDLFTPNILGLDSPGGGGLAS